jgi:hypothetical protein
MERNEQGKWLPGCSSPNPSGRPKGAIRRIRAICLESAEELVRELTHIALDRNERARDRIAACALLLNRALGRAPETPDDDEEQVDLKTRVMRLINPELRLHLGLSASSKTPLPIPDTSVNEKS